MATLNPGATVTVSLQISKAMFAGIERRAAAMNTRPAEYVRRLVDAAYLARIADEKDMPSDDDALDAAVAAVFRHAGDPDPASIAIVTGFPSGLVQRVLEGLRIASRGYSAPSGAGPSGGARDDARPPVGGSAPPEIAARGFAEGPARAEADAPQLGGAEARAAPAGETTPAPPTPTPDAPEGGGRRSRQARRQGVDRRRPHQAQGNVGRRRHDDAHRQGARPARTGRAPVCGGSPWHMPEAAR